MSMAAAIVALLAALSYAVGSVAQQITSAQQASAQQTTPPQQTTAEVKPAGTTAGAGDPS